MQEMGGQGELGASLSAEARSRGACPGSALSYLVCLPPWASVFHV